MSKGNSLYLKDTTFRKCEHKILFNKLSKNLTWYIYSILGRWVAKLALFLLATAALWVRTSNPDISQKYKMGDISKGYSHWPTNSSPPKIKQKIFNSYLILIYTYIAVILHVLVRVASKQYMCSIQYTEYSMSVISPSPPFCAELAGVGERETSGL
jgi:hypothetical protein